MTSYLYRRDDGTILGACDPPDKEGRVPQTADYDTYGVVAVDDGPLEDVLNYGGAGKYRVRDGAVVAATAQELAATAQQQATTPAGPVSVPLDVLVANLPAMVADVQGKTYDAAAWLARLRSQLP